MVTIEVQPILCLSCDGRGIYFATGMGADNMDVWGEWDFCPVCGGNGWETAEEVLVDHGADIDPVVSQ